MATLGEMTGGRDGFSCSRPVISSGDIKNIRDFAKEKKEKDVLPNSDEVRKDFREKRI